MQGQIYLSASHHIGSIGHRQEVWRRECWLSAGTIFLLLIAIFALPITQTAHYHDFADQRSWLGLAHAMDVLSNLPFLLLGVYGAWALTGALRVRAINAATAAMAGLFFFGLMLTAAVSAGYHLQPHDAGLVWDRTGMVFAFAGLIGLGAVQSVSARAGVSLAVAILVLGPLSVQWWAYSGNILPWSVLQAGGMLLVLCFAVSRPYHHGRTLPIRWSFVIALYVLAKVLELADHLVFDWTGERSSGHSLKHIVAACAAWPVVVALVKVRKNACRI